MKKPIVFTDLDGTLLDAGYSFEAAVPALALLKERDIPLIVCSSKTRKEIERHRVMLGNRHPFVTENGGGIFIPRGYGLDLSSLPGQTVTAAPGYAVIRLGADYRDLRRAIAELQREGFAVRGFGDMSVAEVAETTALRPEQAELAREREFDEPFLFSGNGAEKEGLLAAIRKKGFHSTEGRFLHILGDSDKGRAVEMLAGLYRQRYGDISTIAVGDSLNDLPMLEKVDCPVLVQKPDGSYDPRIALPNLVQARGIGPAGWDRELPRLVREILDE